MLIQNLLTLFDDPIDRMGDMESILLPRVVNKLTLCVYPWTTIPLHVEHITGLSNDKLEKQARFDSNLVTSLASFLTRLHPPVCLVAHNGVKFDFPLLQAELFKANGSLLDGLLCCDSWLGANHIYIKQSIDEAQTEHLNEKEKSAERFETLEEVAAAERLVEAGAFQDTLEEPILELIDSQEEINCRTPTRASNAPSSLSLTPPPSGGTSNRKRGGGGGEAFDAAAAEGSPSPSKLRRPDGGLTPEAKVNPQVLLSPLNLN